MTIMYTSDESLTMALQAALAAVDGHLAGQTNEDDMAEAYERLQAAILLLEDIMTASADIINLADAMMTVATDNLEFLTALNANGHDLAKSALARISKAEEALKKAGRDRYDSYEASLYPSA